MVVVLATLGRGWRPRVGAVGRQASGDDGLKRAQIRCELRPNPADDCEAGRAPATASGGGGGGGGLGRHNDAARGAAKMIEFLLARQPRRRPPIPAGRAHNVARPASGRASRLLTNREMAELCLAAWPAGQAGAQLIWAPASALICANNWRPARAAPLFPSPPLISHYARAHFSLCPDRAGEFCACCMPNAGQRTSRPAPRLGEMRFVISARRLRPDVRARRSQH